MQSKFSQFVALCLSVMFGLVVAVQSPTFTNTHSILESSSVIDFTSGQPILAGWGWSDIDRTLDDIFDRRGADPEDISPGKPGLGDLKELLKPVPANPPESQPASGQSPQNFQGHRDIDRATGGGSDVDRNNSGGERKESGVGKNVA